MQDNDEISVVRRWISNQRIDIANQIAALRGKLSLLDQMEKELGKVVPHQPVYKTAPRSASRGGKQQAAALLALEAAGARGLSGREFADAAQIPIGSATGRLSVMKKQGILEHKGNRYFVVHSTQEDNNADQSA
jgi:hypothetical protein